MKTSLPLVALLAAGSIAPLAQAERPQIFLEAAALNADSGTEYAYDLQMVAVENGQPYMDAELSWVPAVDQESEPEISIITSTPALDPVSEDDAERIGGLKEVVSSNIWCAELMMHIPDDAELVSQTDTEATYAFTPLPDPEDDDEIMEKVLARSEGVIVLGLDRPGVRSFNVHLPESFKPNLVVRARNFSMDIECAYAPDGRTYFTQRNMHMQASAMFQNIEMDMRQSLTNLRAVD